MIGAAQPDDPQPVLQLESFRTGLQDGRGDIGPRSDRNNPDGIHGRCAAGRCQNRVTGFGHFRDGVVPLAAGRRREAKIGAVENERDALVRQAALLGQIQHVHDLAVVYRLLAAAVMNAVDAQHI